MFISSEHHPKFDEYGEIINANDFLPEPLEEDDVYAYQKV